MVRQLRSALEVEKRQAAAEARAATQHAVANVRALLAAGLVADGNVALQEAVDSGVIKKDSSEHKILTALLLASAQRAQGVSAPRLTQAMGNLYSPGGGSTDDEKALWEAFTQAELNKRLASLPEQDLATENPEGLIEMHREEARAHARKLVIQELALRRPHKVPGLLREMVQSARNTGSRGEVGRFLHDLRALNPGIVDAVLEEDPVLAITLDDLRASGAQVTPQSIDATFSRRSLVPRSEADWNKLTARSPNRQPEIKPENDLTAAIEKLVQDRELRNALKKELEAGSQKQRFIDNYKRAWLHGYSQEEAALFSVRMFTSQFYRSNAAWNPTWLRRENAPESYFPTAIFPTITPDDFATQVNYKVAEAMAAAVNAQRAAEGKPQDVKVRDIFRDFNILVTARPATIGRQSEILFEAHYQLKAPGAPMVQLQARDGQPWQWIVPFGADEDYVRRKFNEAFNLEGKGGLRELAEKYRGRTLRQAYELEWQGAAMLRIANSKEKSWGEILEPIGQALRDATPESVRNAASASLSWLGGLLEDARFLMESAADEAYRNNPELAQQAETALNEVQSVLAQVWQWGQKVGRGAQRVLGEVQGSLQQWRQDRLSGEQQPGAMVFSPEELQALTESSLDEAQPEAAMRWQNLLGKIQAGLEQIWALREQIDRGAAAARGEARGLREWIRRGAEEAREEAQDQPQRPRPWAPRQGGSSFEREQAATLFTPEQVRRAGEALQAQGQRAVETRGQSVIDLMQTGLEQAQDLLKLAQDRGLEVRQQARDTTLRFVDDMIEQVRGVAEFARQTVQAPLPRRPDPMQRAQEAIQQASKERENARRRGSEEPQEQTRRPGHEPGIFRILRALEQAREALKQQPPSRGADALERAIDEIAKVQKDSVRLYPQPELSLEENMQKFTENLQKTLQQVVETARKFDEWTREQFTPSEPPPPPRWGWSNRGNRNARGSSGGGAAP
jgi:hypothetical protein